MHEPRPGETLGELPFTRPEDFGVVVRTDYSDDAAWSETRSALGAPPPLHAQDAFGSLGPALLFVDNQTKYNAVRPETLIATQGSEAGPRRHLFVADRQAQTTPDHQVLIVLNDAHGIHLYRTPSDHMYALVPRLGFQTVESTELDSLVGEDGLFQGFPDLAEDRGS